MINARAAAPVAPQLDPSTGGIAWVSHHPVTGALARIARDAVELLGSDLALRIRLCEGRGCQALFLDTSRGGTRRWCTMELCGNRLKVAAYQRRRRSDRKANAPRRRVR